MSTATILIDDLFALGSSMRRIPDFFEAGVAQISDGWKHLTLLHISVVLHHSLDPPGLARDNLSLLSDCFEAEIENNLV